jgi:hypothetical protein
MTGDRLHLSAELDAVLRRLGKKIEAGAPLDLDAALAAQHLAQLSASDVVGLEGHIVLAGGLWRRGEAYRLIPRLWGWKSEAEQLRRTPLLAHVMIFHRDGRLREAALKAISGPISSAFLAAAICWRLNDWVRPVREAAVGCIERCFGVTDPGIIAETLAALMVRRNSWGRWEGEREQFDLMLAREDVAQAMVDIFERRSTGPMARLLRACLAGPHLEARLSDIFASAAQPAVRAIALGAMIDREIVQPNGRHEYEWVDKSMGLRRWVKQFDRRPVATAMPTDALIRTGIDDRSAMVRAVALSGAIRHLRGTSSERNYALKLQGDRSRSIRDRAKFILEHPDTKPAGPPRTGHARRRPRSRCRRYRRPSTSLRHRGGRHGRQSRARRPVTGPSHQCYRPRRLRRPRR